jgi:hypothetical protein
VGFSPNKEHIMMSSWRECDVKVLGAKVRRFLAVLSDSGHPGYLDDADELHTINKSELF